MKPKIRHPIMLSRSQDLTKLVVLKCYDEKIFHTGLKQTLNEFRNEL